MPAAAVTAPSPEAPPGLAPRPAPPARPPLRLTRPGADATFTVAVAALLSAVALKGGGGLSLGPLTTVSMALQLVGGVLGALALLLGGSRRLHGGLTLALFALLTGITIASVSWAVQPSDAWLEGARTLSYLATFGGGRALRRLAPQRRAGRLGGGRLAAVFICGYALASKVFPATLSPDETYARLREPFGYWNAVGLMAAMGVPGCLWLGARRHGHGALNALAYPALGLLLVALLLAYSRGSLLAMGLGVAVWMAVVPLRLRALAVLVPGGIGAGLVATWAFHQDALSKDKVPLDLRTSAGHELGVALLALVLVLLAVGLIATFAASRQAPSARLRRRAGIAALVVVALVPFAVAGKLALSDRGLGGSISHSWTQLTDPDASTPANDPGRLTAVGSVRARYYDQALKIYKEHKLEGAGAGGYATARARFRVDGYAVRHAHGYPFQTIADLGLLGLLTSLALTGAWLTAAVRNIGLTPRRLRAGAEPFTPERVGLATLATIAFIFGVHSAVDWTWFVPGTCVPALLCAAWVAGRGDHRLAPVMPATASLALRERLRIGARNRLALGAAAGVVLIALAFAWATWQPLRSVRAGDDALELVVERKNDAAREAAQRARDRDPLSIEPLFVLSVVAQQARDQRAARGYLEQAVQLQPRNAASWLALAQYDLDRGDPKQALKSLGAALYLDPRSVQAVTLFFQATRATGATAVVPPGGAQAAPPTATP